MSFYIMRMFDIQCVELQNVCTVSDTKKLCDVQNVHIPRTDAWVQKETYCVKQLNICIFDTFVVHWLNKLGSAE